MSWAGLANNQAVNGNNLQDAVNNGIFTLKSGQSITQTTECLTRDEAYSKLNVTPISGNKVVIKSDLVGSLVIYDAWWGHRSQEYANFSSEPVVSQAQNNEFSSNRLTLYSTSNWANGVTVYTDQALTTPFPYRAYITNGISLFITYTDGKVYISNYNNQSMLISNLFTHEFKWGTPTGGQPEACAGTSTTIYGFSNSPTISLGDMFQHDSSDAQWLNDGVNVYEYIYTLGVTSIGTCSSEYTVIYDCYWLQSDDEMINESCIIFGDQTYYNNTGYDGWVVGDIVYEYVGGEYLPISRNYDINTAISYTSQGLRSWIIIEGFSGVVIDAGTCP